MRGLFKGVAAVFLFFSLVSCASSEGHQHVLGEISKTDGVTTGVACLRGVNADVGQRLVLLERVCKQGTYGNRWVQKQTTVCENVKKGEVEVIARANPHEVEVRAIGTAELKTGFIVKRTE